jgi:hypothetical protein
MAGRKETDRKIGRKMQAMGLKSCRGGHSAVAEFGVDRACRLAVVWDRFEMHRQGQGLDSYGPEHPESWAAILRREVLRGNVPLDVLCRNAHEAADLGMDEDWEPAQVPTPTPAAGGTAAKFRILMERVQRGEQLFHEQDGVPL